MEERRRIDRVGYQAKSVIVVCDTGESILWRPGMSVRWA